jgi:NAD(P)-dependent dehydrogenase (short-subunit alcohol dehydrogenase family)
MNAKLKPLSRQVLVVTGAVAGVGLETARQAARAGAAVVVTARDEAALRRLAAELSAEGARVHPVAADLVELAEAAKVARAAAARFGDIDAWINSGGEGGHQAAVNGSEAAAQYFEGRKGAGVVINVASAPSETKGFTDSLRRTLRRSKAAVSVTLVRRSATPQAVARAVLFAAQHPVAELGVGRRGRKLTATETSLVVGAGALALAAAAAFLVRGAIGARARPVIARAVRPVLLRAASRRPVTTARFAARHPRQALRLVRALR